jgi:hypothetical protein
MVGDVLILDLLILDFHDSSSLGSSSHPKLRVNNKKGR